MLFVKKEQDAVVALLHGLKNAALTGDNFDLISYMFESMPQIVDLIDSDFQLLLYQDNLIHYSLVTLLEIHQHTASISFVFSLTQFLHFFQLFHIKM